MNERREPLWQELGNVLAQSAGALSNAVGEERATARMDRGCGRYRLG